MKTRPDRAFSVLGALPLFVGCAWCQATAPAPISLGVPAISAQAKGPDQINLTWAPVAEPGYGFVVEVQSSADSRYASWTAFAPVPLAGGYTCDGAIFMAGGRCQTSDPTGVHVYNTTDRGIPYWVTEGNYIDPQDGSHAQFIAWGLRPGTTYRFRVRTYSGPAPFHYGDYSPVADAKTAEYEARYVSTSGKDSNTGKAPDPAHAWRTLSYAVKNIDCGQVLIVMGGTYANDQVQMARQCTAAAKAVVMVNPGESATLISRPVGSANVLLLAGEHNVIDGLRLAPASGAEGSYDVEVRGNFNALLNVESHPAAIPSSTFGVAVYGAHNLVYRCYLHDYGSPDPVQNPGGNSGFVLALVGAGASGNVIWSNHLTRGGHDVSLCKGGCNSNRWLNNTMDGGWGQGFASASEGGASNHNLVEGNVIKNAGQLAGSSRTAIQVSSAENTVRRNVVIGTSGWAIEVNPAGGSGSDNLIYNNTIYAPDGCYLNSTNRGPRRYGNVIYANNICFKSTKPPGVADREFDSPVAKSLGRAINPRFAGAADSDFHLSLDSPLIGAGLPVSNRDWGSSTGTVDSGAFGLSVSTASYWPAGEAMERGRAADYEGALKGLRSTPGTANTQALEAALLRAADNDAAAAAVLVGMPSPDPADLMGRFERVQQGQYDPALWAAFLAAPDRTLELADRYLQWGLTRDALDLLGHRGPTGAPAPDDALFIYYRSYCRLLLDYPYYAAEDLRIAATRSLKDVPAGLGAALTVLQSALQRRPLDAHAEYLVALAHRAAGRAQEARDALESALVLRPGFPDAEALLAKLPPGPARKVRPGAPAGVSSATGSPAAGLAPKSPAEVAALALRIAATGDITGALSYFTPNHFSNPKQEPTVRETYFELRLQRVMALASAKQCANLEQAIAALDAPDHSLPFTAAGFADLTSGARVQFLIGSAESACGNQAAARKRWDAVSKVDAAITSIDYAYPMLALAQLEPEVGKARSRKALTFLSRQLGPAAGSRQGALFFSQGLLLALIGKQAEAASSFQAGAESGPPGLIEYLNLEALRSR